MDAPTGRLRHHPALSPPPGYPKVDSPEPDGRPPVSADVAALIERLAAGKSGWGYTRIHGATEARLWGQGIDDPPDLKG